MTSLLASLATPLSRLRRPSVTPNLVSLRWLVFFAILLVAAPAQAALELRIAIRENSDRVQVGASTTATIKDPNGRPLGRLQAQMGNDARSSNPGQVSFGTWQGQQLWVEPEEDGLVWIGDRWYRGRVLLTPTAKGVTAVNYVDLEDYLYSVVASEMPTSWHPEALKAQAVAARSYALHKRSTMANPVYDLGNTTAFQVYKGVAVETDSTHAAVRSTAGQVLTYNGSVIEAVFHSASGGHTENVEDVWSKAIPYLRGVPDFDQSSPRYSWTESFSAAQLRSKLASQISDIASVGNIISLVPADSSPHGRIRTLRVVGDQGSRLVKGAEVRTALGLQSTRFEVLPQGSQGKGSQPGSFVLRGYGYGHGIGMSQYGAKAMADQGKPYQAILSHYYQNTALSSMAIAP